MNKVIFFFLILRIWSLIHGQNVVTKEYAGKVTYQSSQNIYVSFESTEWIKKNDTLYINLDGRNVPAVLVSFISSRSCAGPVLNGIKLKIGDDLKAFVKLPLKKEPGLISASKKENPTAFVPPLKEAGAKNISANDAFSSNILKGRFSIQSYLTFSNLKRSNNVQRWRYSLSSETKNLLGSSLTFTNYITFSYNAHEWSKATDNLGRSIRVYDLSVKYDYENSFSIWAGRYINPKISSIGSVDGIQTEKKWKTFYLGAVVGSRPDFSDFGFNFKLFETGLYLGKSDTLKNGTINNTLALLNQTNDFRTDRRYLYFQHDNYIFTNISFFVSSEMDLYKREKGENKNKLSLTSLYLMSRYSPASWLSFSISYDARKNVIYYETFKNFADSLFDKQTRQGIRGGINLRPAGYLYVGLEAGYRFQKTDIKPSRNYSGYISYSRIPLLELSASLNFSKISGSYVDGLLYGANFSKDFISGLMSASAGLKRVEYSLVNSGGKLLQNLLSTDISFLLMKNTYLITTYEGVFEGKNSSGRVLLEISSRF